MLRFPEELMLLILDDENGKFARVPDRQLRYALAGGVLMDLALENRIDTDLKQLMLVDATPLGDDLLDPTLADIAAAKETHDARFWVERTALRSADDIRQAALDRLVERGILQRQGGPVPLGLQVAALPGHRRPARAGGQAADHGDPLQRRDPTPRDVVIIGLAHACNLFEQILSAREVEHIAPRIDEVRRLDLIGQAMAQAISDIEVSLALALHMPPYS